MIYLRGISLSFPDRKIFDRMYWTITDRSRERLALRVRPERIDREAPGGMSMTVPRRDQR